MIKNRDKIISFLKKLPPTTFVAISGDCGKSTVYAVIDSIFKKSEDSIGGLLTINLDRDDLFDNYLKEVKREGVLLAIVREELLELLVQARVIPNVLVVTYIKDATRYIPLIQSFTYTNYLVGSDEAIDEIKKKNNSSIKGKMLRTGIAILPKGGKLSSEPKHIRENISLAVRVSEIFEIPLNVVVSVLASFKNLSGRLELVKKVKDVTYINDGYSQNFAALSVAMRTVSNDKNIVLIIGGDGSGIDERDDLSLISKHCHTIITIPGSGTQKLYKVLLKDDDLTCIYSDSIEDAVKRAVERSKKDDIVLFSPGFCPTMLCGADRGERSMKFIQALNTI